MQALSLFCRGICRFPRFANDAIRQYQITFLQFPSFVLLFGAAFLCFLVCYVFLSALGYKFTSPEGERLL